MLVYVWDHHKITQSVLPKKMLITHVSLRFDRSMVQLGSYSQKMVVSYLCGIITAFNTVIVHVSNAVLTVYSNQIVNTV